MSISRRHLFAALGVAPLAASTVATAKPARGRGPLRLGWNHVSTDKQEFSIEHHDLIHYAVVFLDGVRQDHVCVADEIGGYIIVEVHENGKPKIDHENRRYVREARYGFVHIKDGRVA